MDSWRAVWKAFRSHRLGLVALFVVLLFCVVGIYAPLLASSKPIVVYYEGHWYFPLFRYLFYRGFFTKNLDLFYNLLMFTLPLLIISIRVVRNHLSSIFAVFAIIQLSLFLYVINRPSLNPAADIDLTSARQARIEQGLASGKLVTSSWDDELAEMTPYAKLNMLLRYQQRKAQNEKLEKMTQEPVTSSLWAMEVKNDFLAKERLKEIMGKSNPDDASYKSAKARLDYMNAKERWLESQSPHLKFIIMPLLSHFHWEEDAGGSQYLNSKVSWWNLTRTNRKDLVSALIFGIRISLSVGIVSIALALLIGIPIGAIAGFYGGKTDIVICRLIELWEAMPIFFMLLMIVAFFQSKSIFLVVAIIGLFGWTSFSRYVRGEFLKQKQMPYVEACYSLGYSQGRIIFSHLLPNAIPPLLTLVPFAIMGAITSEAGLSFLGLGEENSCSWGVLMDEGRSAFPAESDLLWPPAILLTVLLVAIALVGDSLRDTLDPKMRR